MSAFNQVLIGGYPGGGLTTDRKPAMLADEAFSNLQNAYVWRERVKKRIGTDSMGRLQRHVAVDGHSLTAGSINLVSALGLESTAQISPGTINIVGAVDGTTYKDTNKDGILIASGGTGTGGSINYATGLLSINAGAAEALTGTVAYFPGLPVMGICKKDITSVGIDDTIFFDTKYAYQFTTGQFQELASTTPTTWTGSNTDFFWTCNYQGADTNVRLFFATNNNITSGAATPYDPIRYYNNTTWTDLKPLVTATNTLFQALIVIPYYGRLLALNTWEGTTVGGPATAVNFFARCRFSQIGSPIAADAWRSDQFGKGGFIDAPTNESIVSVAFFRNTLIVFFEYSTWQLRYIGEYGLPFIWERISSDFGSVSTSSSIVFDQGVMTVSDRGIIQASAGGLTRLDEQIPDTVFSFEIQNKAPNFVHGIRDFEKEVVYWNYIDTTNIGEFQNFPNTTLLFNYRNNTWAQFRDTITCFGTAQFQLGITWDSLATYWDSEVSWDSSDDQNYVDYVTAGNQQGFISIYENAEVQAPVPDTTIYAQSLYIASVDFTKHPTQFTVPNHNLQNGELIYITNSLWSGIDPGINNIIYNVTPVDADTITLSTWTGSNYNDVDITSSAVYMGKGVIALLPVMNIVGKDFNPYQAQGKQFKISFIDFQMDSNEFIPSIPAVTVQLFVNSYLGEQANLLTGNQELLNSSLLSGVIAGAEKTNPCLIYSPGHSLETGTVIYIANVQGMTNLNSANYTITVVDANHFSLDGIDATGFGTYTTGGIWNALPVLGTRYQSGSKYAWYRFYSTNYGQYLRVAITYDDALMNQIATHQTSMELNAMNFWFREGGRLIN